MSIFKLPEFFVHTKQTPYYNLWYKDIMKLDEVRKITKNIKAAPVCVLDNTANITNASLEHNVTEIWEFTEENGEAGLHGHHVAGIIACEKYGMSPNVKIGTFKVLTSGSGYGMSAWIVAGIRKAQAQGYKVINASLGSDTPDAEIKAAIKDFCDAGGYFICAAGNDGKETDYPAAWANEIEGVFAIGALYHKDGDRNSLKVDAYSSSGIVSYVMPGTLILSSLPDNQYGELTGTSMATPFFSGLVANILGIHVNLHPKDLVELCNLHCKDVEKGNLKDGNGYPSIYDIIINAKSYTPKYRYTNNLKKWYCNFLPFLCEK